MAATEQYQKAPRDLKEPAHHARRPMNAFLIFCKRHRSSVRKEFPHLENRAVTRVLGEWWATLRPDQKRAYTSLAQEYKDAFLNANPDFKWYKLPAPPLRTLTTRPTNKKQEIGVDDQSTVDVTSDYQSSNSLKTEPRDNDGSIQPGKLADESQIGGLSSLFTPQKIFGKFAAESTNDNDLAHMSDVSTLPKAPKKQYIEIPINNDQRRKCKVDLFCVENAVNTESNNNEQHHLNEEEVKNDTNIYLDCNKSPGENNYRGERSCKGLRYQQLMAEQQRNIGTTSHQAKRRRLASLNTPDECPNERRNSVSSNVSEKTDSLSSEGGNSSRSDLEHLVESKNQRLSAEGNLEASKPEDTETEDAEVPQDYREWRPYKRFKAEDFNLEKKIEALPSLSLAEFQEKKKQQRTKKKKIPQKLCSNVAKRGHGNLPHGGQTNAQSICQTNDNIADHQEEAEKALLVGSQKRKARKQSITRNAAATSTFKNDDDQDANNPWCASPDLEALACLAEIAANQMKLTK